jgi:hypothetical protein
LAPECRECEVRRCIAPAGLTTPALTETGIKELLTCGSMIYVHPVQRCFQREIDQRFIAELAIQD